MIQIPTSRLVTIASPPSSKYGGRPVSVLLAFKDVQANVGGGLALQLGAVGNEKTTPTQPRISGLSSSRYFLSMDVFGPISVYRAACLYIWNDSPSPVGMGGVSTRQVWDETKDWGVPNTNHYHLIVLLNSRIEFPQIHKPVVDSFLGETDRIRAFFDQKDDDYGYEICTQAHNARAAHLNSPVMLPASHAPVAPVSLEYLDPHLLAHAITLLPHGTIYRNQPPSFQLPPP